MPSAAIFFATLVISCSFSLLMKWSRGARRDSKQEVAGDFGWAQTARSVSYNLLG